MPREYKAQTNAIAGAASMDLASILSAAGKFLRILRIECNATDASAPTSGEVNFRCRYLPATVTQGSGGTTPTPTPMDHGDAAFSGTTHMNDTSGASSSGSAVVLWSGAAHVLTGLDYTFEKPPIINPATAFTFEMLTLPTGTIHFDTTVSFEEIG